MTTNVDRRRRRQGANDVPDTNQRSAMFVQCKKWDVSYVNKKGYRLCVLPAGHEGEHLLEPDEATTDADA